MNIIDAIKKARAERGTVSTKFSWHYKGTYGGSSIAVAPGQVDPSWLLAIIGDVQEAALLCDDWEVKEPEITLTRKQFLDAYADVLKDEFSTRYSDFHFPAWTGSAGERINRLAEKLFGVKK